MWCGGLVYKWYPPRDLVYSSNVYQFMERFGFANYSDLVGGVLRITGGFGVTCPDGLVLSGLGSLGRLLTYLKVLSGLSGIGVV